MSKRTIEYTKECKDLALRTCHYDYCKYEANAYLLLRMHVMGFSSIDTCAKVTGTSTYYVSFAENQAGDIPMIHKLKYCEHLS